jgi:hypothetical protein
VQMIGPALQTLIYPSLILLGENDT